MLAMHMANELLSPRVAIAFMVISGFVLYLAAAGAQGKLDPARVPLMGVLGAFVFAAQMINFPILSGTSGHLVGSLLLAIVLGPNAASLVMASILVIQCLIFQDGGILALGTNILNMGIIPCYVGYAIFRAIAGRAPATGRLFAAIFIASLIGVCSGAALVPVETRLSGVLAVSFSHFLLIMVGLHLLVASVEGFITFAVVTYLVRVRPSVLEFTGIRFDQATARLNSFAVAGSILVVGFLLAGVGSLFASKYPDALDSLTGGRPEHSMVSANENPTVAAAKQWQEKAAPLPDYGVRGHEEWWSTSASGIVGTIVTLLLVWGIARFLRTSRPPALSAVTEGEHASPRP